MSGGVFICYRREESAFAARAIHDRVVQRLERDNVFLDVDNIDLGVDWFNVLTDRVGACDALVAVIGRNWISAEKDGLRRLDDPDDFVRIEIEAALKRGVRVIPVLVDGAAMPKASELPDSLKGLARRQGTEVSPARFEADVEKLTHALGSILEERRARDAVEAERRADEERRAKEAIDAERAAREEIKKRDATEKAERERSLASARTAGARGAIEERPTAKAVGGERTPREKPEEVEKLEATGKADHDGERTGEPEREKRDSAEKAEREWLRKEVAPAAQASLVPHPTRGDPRDRPRIWPVLAAVAGAALVLTAALLITQFRVRSDDQSNLLAAASGNPVASESSIAPSSKPLAQPEPQVANAAAPADTGNTAPEGGQSSTATSQSDTGAANLAIPSKLLIGPTAVLSTALNQSSPYNPYNPAPNVAAPSSADRDQLAAGCLPGLLSAPDRIRSCQSALEIYPVDPRLQFQLGSALASKGSYGDALPWLRKAAENGYAPAQTGLGELYANGQGVKQDYAQARAWYMKAADQSDWQAEFKIGELYLNGWGVKQDLAKAMEWQQKAQAQSSNEFDRLDGEAKAAISRIKKY